MMRPESLDSDSPFSLCIVGGKVETEDCQYFPLCFFDLCFNWGATYVLLGYRDGISLLSSALASSGFMVKMLGTYL